MVFDRGMAALVTAWGLLGLVVAGPARGQDGLAAELDYERGHVVAREIVSLGHAIVGELIEPHYHGRRVCYEPHLVDVPPLDITYIEDYTTAPSEIAARYRHAHHHGNVVEEHAHHLYDDHDHHPGGPLDYLAAYERYQKTEQPQDFDEYVFVLERFERKVPTYRIHGSPQPKPRRPDSSRPEKSARKRGDARATREEPADESNVVAGDAPAHIAANAGDAGQVERPPDAIVDSDVVVIDDPGKRHGHPDGPDEDDGRMVDRYRERRREARQRFDDQTHNRLDPSRNRRAMKTRAERQREDAHATSLSERIEADRAALGARIDDRALQQSNRLEQRMIDSAR